MKKRIIAVCCIGSSALFLTSCSMRYGPDLPWWAVCLIIVAAFAICGLLYSRKKYVCPKCGGTVNPKWFSAVFSKHMGSRLMLTCPHCGAREYCKPLKKNEKDE